MAFKSKWKFKGYRKRPGVYKEYHPKYGKIRYRILPSGKKKIISMEM
jgi:hypothetical protein